MKAERQAVYDALDAMPDMIFAAYVSALESLNRVMALTVLDDPTPAQVLDEAIAPHVQKFGTGAQRPTAPTDTGGLTKKGL